jgi:UDP-glucuronate 4-epimerase
MAVWLFTEAMLAGRPIKVYNHGNMRRDFTYIDDIVKGTVAALFAGNLGSCEIINLGNHRPEELMDMIRTIAEALCVEPRMELLPMQQGDVVATYADIARAREKLGFEPVTEISAGIPAFIRWYREYHGV